MAYILGFLFADGNIDSKSYYISFAQNNLYILQQIKSYLKVGTIYRNDNMYIYTICSRSLANRLKKLNVTPKKTKTIIPPKVPINYINSFLLGIFDGDGCIAKCGNSYSVEFLSASSNLIYYIKNNLEQYANVSKRPIYKRKTKNTFVYILRFYKRQDIKLLFEFLYSMAHFYLERKNKKFIEAMNYYNNNKVRKDFDNEADYRLYSARKKGYKNIKDYNKMLLRRRGFNSYYQYYKTLLKQRGFKSVSEYLYYLKNK